ncbi:MAG: MFS transporter [Saprospiraceae bacterium]|nr:MFS transporter [Saprospiraceae bacterium]MBK6565175.1 MFS transporter [Saprospiraceae bacterium]MBK6785912.1 MFS transporter [Saprospiraceae bacterium]MBK7523717.1 MFS transporter [Saprospiraceae bacterium]MBK8820695.1 MFS transporter [Saprospiraceae bacterium]
MRYISRTVWILSLISLFTDTASEMLYPIMPIYLRTIGFSIVLIGILEGVAEATAGLSKGYFGKLSDTSGRRVPFVQIGYVFSAISKPMMAIFTFPFWIFFARTIDRFGKGIRTGARDAILSDEATPQTKGKVFGFHRSMDTIGAVIGPTLALLYLYYFPQDYKTLFFLAFIPGLFAVISSFFLKSEKINEKKTKVSTPFFSFLKYWKTSPPEYRKLVFGLLLFTLFNSSDVFLLLQAKQSGLDDTMVIGVYIFYNLIYALFAFPVGIFADKVGLKTIFIVGLMLFATVYFGMAVNTNLYMFFGLFFLYGIYASSTEGISKAWISNITDKKDTATAIGTFSGLQSICTMLASSLTGLLWFQFGATAAFITTATLTLFVIVYFFTIPDPRLMIKG